MSAIERLSTRRERVCFLNGFVEGLQVCNASTNAEELDAKLEKYRKEIDSLNDVIEQEAKG